MLAWDARARVEDFDGHGIAACILVEVHGWCDFAGEVGDRSCAVRIVQDLSLTSLSLTSLDLSLTSQVVVF